MHTQLETIQKEDKKEYVFSTRSNGQLKDYKLTYPLVLLPDNLYRGVNVLFKNHPSVKIAVLTGCTSFIDT